MIIYNKNPTTKDKRDISHCTLKEVGRRSVGKTKKITKENKIFLKNLGYKLQNVANHRSTTLR